ncbi:uncharacterized protein V6R79_008769 [Siganus canaliculatus]
MDKPEKHNENPVLGAESKLLKDSGKRRKERSCYFVSDSSVSERQKLRHVLDWAQRFISHEFHYEASSVHCTFDASYYDDACLPVSFNPDMDGAVSSESRERPENVKEDKCIFSQDNVNTDMSFQLHDCLLDSCTNHVIASECATGLSKETELNERRFDVNVQTKMKFRDQDSENHISKNEMKRTVEIPQTLSIYEQYQLCVDQLDRLRRSQSQHTEPGCFEESNGKERKASEETATLANASGLSATASDTNPKIHKHSDTRATAAEIPKERSTDVVNKTQHRSKYSSSGAALKQAESKDRDSLNAEETCAHVTGDTRLCLDDNKCKKSLRGNVDGKTLTDAKTPLDHRRPVLDVNLKETDALTTHPADFSHQESSSEPQRTKLISLQLVETHKNVRHFQRHIHRLLVAPDHRHQPGPAGVPVCVSWLYLPDEVWLSILSLLPHTDLCRVAQVCSRLHTLTSDNTLWEDVRIENCHLTEPWLLCVGGHGPRRLCLYSCRSLSLTSWELQRFFTLCRKSLEELKVTSCTGPGLHGDQILNLIGQLCVHITAVDVSWSGATDTGVKALGDCNTSLHRLEVFGCHFLTPSCLNALYEMCPDLEHLNIGQLPKVDGHSLTVMASQLKRLISVNLTGLQAVSDAIVDTLLQNCIKLESLTLSCCPGVTDLTLINISKYTPCIRSLDVSGCKAVTDRGVQSLALGCGRLQQLDLSSTSTGNRGVSLLANYCSSHLHTVKLSFCYITTDNIRKLCRHCKGLKVLHLYGCSLLPTEKEVRAVNNTVAVYPALV